MTPEVERFLRNTHILARLVEQIFETGYLRRTSGEAVTFDQLNILKFLSRPQTTLVKDVARFLNASNAAASKAVSRLVQKRWARTSTYGADRRAEVVRLTPKGMTLVREYEELKRKRLQLLLRPGEAQSLSEGLERVIAVLMREREMAGNPCLGCGAYYSQECVVRLHGQTCSCPIRDAGDSRRPGRK